MALQLLDGIIDYDRVFPKIGCGIKFIFEEDDFVLQAGVQSSISLIISTLLGTLTDGDKINIHGYEFTFVTSTPENFNQVLIDGNNTATRLKDQVDNIPFFIDNYNVNAAGTAITFQNKQAKLDENFFFSKDLVDPDGVVEGPSNSGQNPVVKEDYYIYYEVYDYLTNEKLCADPIPMPLNVFSDYSTKVGINIQTLIARSTELSSMLPIPFPPNPSGNRLDKFDPNYIRGFYFRVWNSYRDPNSTLSCKRVQSDIITIPQDIPTSADRIRIANFVQKDDQDCGEFVESAFEPYWFQSTAPTKFLTVMPESYKVCQTTQVEAKFDMPIFLLDDVFGADVQFRGTYYYTDGTSNGVAINWSEFFDGVHTAMMSFDPSNPNTTLGPDPKPLERFEYTMVYVIGSTLFTPFETRVINFDTSNRSKIKCCEDTKALYFRSCVGNNELIVCKEVEQELSIDFYDFCKEQKCCGTLVEGVRQFDSGNVNSAIKQESRTYTVLLEVEDPDYLDQFLLSPFKYEYDKANDAIYRISPTQGSYRIFTKNFRNLVKFTYKRTLIRKHFKL